MSNKPKFAVGDIVFCEGMRVDKFIITRILDNLLYEAEPYKDIYILGEEDIAYTYWAKRILNMQTEPEFKVGDIVYKKFKVSALTKTNKEVLYRLVDPKFPDEAFSVFPESELSHAE